MKKKNRFLIMMVFISLLNYFSLGQANDTYLLEESTISLVNFSKQMNKKLTQKEFNILVNTAKVRHDEILNQLDKNSVSVTKYLLPKNIVSSLPNQLQNLMEKEINEMEGTIELREASNFKGHEIIQYSMYLDNGTHYLLFFSDKPNNQLKTNMKIHLYHPILISSDNKINRLIISSKKIKIIKKPIKSFNDTLGPQRTLVILVNFSDQSNAKPFTPEEVKKVVFDQVNQMFYESSYHQTTVVGEVVGWFTINLNSQASCDTLLNKMPELANSSAIQAGSNLSLYTRLLYMFPKDSNCWWGGNGTIGRNGLHSKAWINGYNTVELVGHELGHNLGLDHSHRLICVGSPNQGNCLSSDYGDNADIMGSGGTAHFNAFKKEQLGWLNYQASPPIQTVGVSGIYTIDVYESINKNYKALKIFRKKYPDGSKEYFYVEFRQPIGFDSDLNCNQCDFTKGILIHQGNDSDIFSSYLLDMTPDDNNANLVSLLPGKSFQDASASDNGITIMLEGISNKSATVQVNFERNPPTCQRRMQTLEITPTETKWLYPGQSFPFNVSVKNNDFLGCPPTRFTLNSLARLPMTASFLEQVPTILINPGETKNLTLTVSAAITATLGIYPITVNSLNGTTPSDNASSTIYVGVFGSSLWNH